MKPITALTFALAIISISFAQSSTDLKSKYGKPVEETFKLNPNLYIKAQYDDKGEACEISIIEYYDQMEKPQTMPSSHEDKIDKLIGDLAPLKDRGELVKTDGGTGSCTGFQSRQYENVHIYRHSNQCSSKSTRVRIRWTSRKCVEIRMNSGRN